jgi:hypothetical protein
VALALAIAACGCGSGGNTTSAQTATDGPTGSVVSSGAEPGAASRHRAVHASGDGSAAADGGKGNAKADSTREGERGGSPVPDGHHSGARPPKQQAAIEEEAVKHCPAGTDLPQCKALVEGAKQSTKTRSFEVKEPEDCLEAMSKSDCEATYAAQKEAAEATGESVDVQACLKSPTPKCEAILRPLFEQQQAAEEAGR